MIRKNRGVEITVIILLILSIAIIFSGCSKKVIADTEENLIFLMLSALQNGNQEQFSSYFIEERRNLISKEEFASLEEEMKGGAYSYENYHVVETPDGRTVLVYLTPGKVSGKYYIQDIKIVPEDMKELFQARPLKNNQ